MNDAPLHIIKYDDKNINKDIIIIVENDDKTIYVKNQEMKKSNFSYKFTSNHLEEKKNRKLYFRF